MRGRHATVLLACLAWACGKDLGIGGVDWPCSTDAECAWGWTCVQDLCRAPGWAPDTGTDPGIEPIPDTADLPVEEVQPDVIEVAGEDVVEDEAGVADEGGPDEMEPVPEVVEEIADDGTVGDETADPDLDVADPVPEVAEETVVEEVATEVVPDTPVEETCTPVCDGHACAWDDGCGGTCGTGTCGATQMCVKGACVCKPDCQGQECGGDDGCGGTCGSCGGGLDCLGAVCVSYSVDGDGCITDEKTGLLWDSAVKANVTSAGANAHCSGMWRVPTIDELRTLIVGCPDQHTFGKCGVTDACAEKCSTLDCAPCGSGGGPAEAGGCYIASEFANSCQRMWSSTVAEKDLALIPTKMWAANFKTGEIAAYGLLTNTIAVRCVRSP
jgi:hypothetical protein